MKGINLEERWNNSFVPKNSLKIYRSHSPILGPEKWKNKNKRKERERRETAFPSIIKNMFHLNKRVHVNYWWI